MSLIEHGNKHVAAFLRTQLNPGEQVIAGIGELATDNRGAVIVTTERIVRYYCGGLLAGERLESIGYDAISSIEGSKPSLGGRGFFLNISTAGKTIQIRCLAGGFGFDDGGKSRMNEYLSAISGAMRAQRSPGQIASPPQGAKAQPSALANAQCRSCGVPIDAAARFCATCGVSVAQPPTHTPVAASVPQRKRGSLIPIILACGALVIAVAVLRRSGEDVAPSGATAARATDLQEAPVMEVGPSGDTQSEGGIRIPSDPRASYAILAKGGTVKLPTLVTRREGSSGVSYAKRRFDCTAHTFMYLGEGDTLEEVKHSKPANEMSALVEGSISDYWWHYACGK